MPWRSRSLMEERLEFVVRAIAGNEDMSSLCQAFGVSRPTGYRWVSRYRATGDVLSLKNLSSRPQSSPNRTSAELEGQVVSSRLRYGWGARKLQVMLGKSGIELPIPTIHRILKRQGLITKPEKGYSAHQRFERSASNELWQMDFKGDVPISGGRCYPLSILDDHSRYAVGLYALKRPGGVSVHSSLVKTFERHGVPAGMLMDHGTPWYSTTNGHGLTWLTVALIKQGIHLTYSGIRHPQTQGKVERFHRTLKGTIAFHGTPQTLDGWKSALSVFQEEYNNTRPHEALQMKPPSSRYHHSERQYNPNPPEWEYPQGGPVKRLNSQGCLDYRGQRLFVCEPLANELVQITELDDLALVKFHKTFIRQINLKTRKSTPLLTEKHPNQL
ncbi:IS481 family transposase [bacterium AH-315-J21]|nr:IS481 family transposase [bacterium AH-315-J21]